MTGGNLIGTMNRIYNECFVLQLGASDLMQTNHTISFYSNNVWFQFHFKYNSCDDYAMSIVYYMFIIFL